MKHATTIRICLGLLAILAVGAGMWLVSTYNLSTDYASGVPTATQTVKVCHNDCRYLAPGIAFLLNLGLGLSTAGGLSVVGLMMWHQAATGSPADANPARLGSGYAIASAIAAMLHGATFSSFLSVFSPPDANETPTPSPGYVYDASAHGGLSYADAVRTTISHLTLPAWGVFAVFTLIAIGVRSVRGAHLRRLDRHDLPMIGFQILGAVIAAVGLFAFGPAIIDALIDSPLGPD